MSLNSREGRLITQLEDENLAMKRKIKWVISKVKDLDPLVIKAELIELMKGLES